MTWDLATNENHSQFNNYERRAFPRADLPPHLEPDMRILIAEDDPSIAAGVSASLRQGGHAVDAVTDGAKADAALRDTPYDLLILDLGLPNLDGADVLQRLRKRGTGLPVLVITAREGLLKGEQFSLQDKGLIHVPLSIPDSLNLWEVLERMKALDEALENAANQG